MDHERRLFDCFLAMHAHKAGPTEHPVAHLHFRDEAQGIPHDAPLIALARDDVLDALDKNAPLVIGLLEQMRTYDCTRQRIVGLVFDKRTVFAEVLRRHPE
jgi:hypothetical protein